MSTEKIPDFRRLFLYYTPWKQQKLLKRKEKRPLVWSLLNKKAKSKDESFFQKILHFWGLFLNVFQIWQTFLIIVRSSTCCQKIILENLVITCKNCKNYLKHSTLEVAVIVNCRQNAGKYIQSDLFLSKVASW